MLPHPIPERPWQVIVTDLFKWNNTDYTVAVDYYSRYFEVEKIANLTSPTVIWKLKAMFARFGIPQCVVSDNGPCYSSQDFKSFAQAWDFEHVTSSPLYPQSNGLADKTVQTAKALMDKAHTQSYNQNSLVAAQSMAGQNCAKNDKNSIMTEMPKCYLHCRQGPQSESNSQLERGNLLQLSDQLRPKDLTTSLQMVKRFDAIDDTFYRPTNVMQGPITSISVLSVGLLCLLLCTRGSRVRAAPICASRHAGCQVFSLPDLFDRAIQHSARMHSISSDLHSEYEQNFLPRKNHIGNRNCHTSSIQTLNGKETAQKLAREELTEVIVKLLAAWWTPLWHFHQSMTHRDGFQNFSSNKALEITDMVHELRKGVEKVAERMQHLGIISNSVNRLESPEAPVPSSDASDWHRMSDFDLLYCFRRDSNKVQNYLKILKCRTVAEHAC
ncbi:prolactin-like [Lampris incognitus]|uniref:prolactin-like n=1 Tax=Lampris incognitus TaxID=2546036 RepID=UPI0024B58268|nr:prolactin-like [Lampris incognitus]